MGYQIFWMCVMNVTFKTRGWTVKSMGMDLTSQICDETLFQLWSLSITVIDPYVGGSHPNSSTELINPGVDIVVDNTDMMGLFCGLWAFIIGMPYHQNVLDLSKQVFIPKFDIIVLGNI